ncbi:hypothetical protein Ae201684P_015816 [Aphanomyces euteiches]|uniref:Tc1-like transposase DDE domain-containing protein n=1 Tax=Aphanomyces euteiches TaxID=100861 RepID=A0A6G0WII0_9STRA|nr:hypothetical protein Ae201684_014780 [Aphanomyces euteiches]KAH9072745.1 hypothetical protein Ae201684P_015816 [Aphanomyces euteiches]
MVNLDGPDGCQYYWHDIRREPEKFSKRVLGGGSVVVWAAVAANGKSKIAILEGKQDSSKYIETLKEFLLPFVEEVRPKMAPMMPVFQQDGASIHTTGVTKAFLQDQRLSVMEWPAKSPDLNIIENVWGLLARSVYEDGRQFDSRASLIQQIQKCWDQIGMSYLQRLVDDMPTRIAEVILKKGARIDR